MQGVVCIYLAAVVVARFKVQRVVVEEFDLGEFSVSQGFKG